MKTGKGEGGRRVRSRRRNSDTQCQDEVEGNQRIWKPGFHNTEKKTARV